MPSPKAFLRDIADFNLDPKHAYKKSSLGSDGRAKQHKGADKPKTEQVTVEPVKAETADVDKKAPVVKKNPPAPVHSDSKQQKKAANAHDSVESKVPSDKQEATEEPDPAKVAELDAKPGV